jgi:hypothetical protein
MKMQKPIRSPRDQLEFSVIDMIICTAPYAPQKLSNVGIGFMSPELMHGFIDEGLSVAIVDVLVKP